MAKEKGSLKSTIAVSLTNYLDAGAIVAGGSGLALWVEYLGLSPMDKGWLNAVSANCLGAAVGAIIGGFMADRFGRKAIYTYNMLIYMLGVLIVMLSVNYPMLLAGFLITGISVGVGVPASWTYISESSEINNRGRNICISQMSWGIGPMVILLLGTLLAPETVENGVREASGALFGLVESTASLFGVTETKAVNVFASRLLFASLFIVAFIAWNLQRKLDESAEWKAQKEAEKQGAIKKSNGLIDSFKVLFTNNVAIKTVAFLAGIYLTWNIVASVMGFFQPDIYKTAGLSHLDSNLLCCVQWVVIVVITFITSKIVDKVSHKSIYVIGLLFAISAWIVIIMTNGKGYTGLWAFSILWGIQGGLSVQIFYALWGTELFPAKFRAGAQGLMFFIVRGLSAAGGIGFEKIYGEHGEGFKTDAYCAVALLVVSLVIGILLAPNTRGKSLDVITKERYGENF